MPTVEIPELIELSQNVKTIINLLQAPQQLGEWLPPEETLEKYRISRATLNRKVAAGEFEKHTRYGPKSPRYRKRQC